MVLDPRVRAARWGRYPRPSKRLRSTGIPTGGQGAHVHRQVVQCAWTYANNREMGPVVCTPTAQQGSRGWMRGRRDQGVALEPSCPTPGLVKLTFLPVLVSFDCAVRVRDPLVWNTRHAPPIEAPGREIKQKCGVKHPPRKSWGPQCEHRLHGCQATRAGPRRQRPQEGGGGRRGKNPRRWCYCCVRDHRHVEQRVVSTCS